MKINLELPDWINPNGTLVILCNQETIAFKNPGKEWKVKKIRCNFCGECCLDVEEGHLPFGTNGEGKCNMLDTSGDKWMCMAGHQKPFSCLVDPNKGNHPDCVVEYE